MERKKILVVEDYELCLEMITQILITAGFDVIPARDGEEAWKILEEGACVDHILSDVEMPKMNGLDLLRMVKTNPRTTPIPFMFISGIDIIPTNGIALTQEFCQKYGASFMLKPFEKNSLLAYLKALT